MADYTKNEYAHVSLTQEELFEELENGEDGMIDYEHEDLVDDGGILIESKRRARIACAKRVLFIALTVAWVMALFAAGMYAGRNVFAAKSTNAVDSALKQNVDSLCSSKAISKMQGLTKCNDICTVASCCHAPEGDGEENCFKTFPDFCEDYRSCNILQQGSDIPDLVALGGHEEEEMVTPDVVVTQDTPMPRSPVSDACHPALLENPQSKQVCQDLCQSFACCFVPDPNTGLTCSDPNCSDWGAPCGILYDAAPNQDNAQPTGNLEQNPVENNEQSQADLQVAIAEACDFNHFPDTRGNCDRLCSNAQCCFESPNDCDLSDQCETTYSSCKVLYDEFYEEPGAMDKFYFNGGTFTSAEVERLVYDTCVANDLTIQEQRRACESACEPAACCYKPEGDEDNCKGERICESFTECNILTEKGLQDFWANQDSGTQGAATDLNSNADENNASDQSSSSELGHDELEEPDGGENIEVNGELRTKRDIEKEINQKCIENDLSSKDYLVACQTTCEPAKCCFVDGDNSCKGYKFCDAFMECQVLAGHIDELEELDGGESIELNGESRTKQDIEKEINQKCKDSDLSIKDDLVACQTICEPATCCFVDGDNTCKGYKFCDAFMECQLLAGHIDELEEPDGEEKIELNGESRTKQNIELDIYRKCIDGDLSSKEDLVACETICEPSICCFVDGDNTCKGYNFCDAFVECQVLAQFVTIAENSAGGENSNADRSNPAPVLQTTGESSTSLGTTPLPEDETDKMNTGSLLNALNELDSSPADAVPDNSVVAQDSIPDVVQDITISEGSLTSVDQETSPQNNDIVQDSAEDQGGNLGEPLKDPDNEEIFILGEKYTKLELETKVHAICADLSSDESRRACNEVCEPSECCSEDGQDGCKGDPFCDAFSFCSVLADDPGNFIAADDGKVFFVDGHKYTEAEIQRKVHSKCALVDLSMQESRQACGDLCKLGKCCFQSGEKSCKGDTFCNAFADCEELIL